MATWVIMTLVSFAVTVEAIEHESIHWQKGNHLTGLGLCAQTGGTGCPRASTIPDCSLSRVGAAQREAVGTVAERDSVSHGRAGVPDRQGLRHFDWLRNHFGELGDGHVTKGAKDGMVADGLCGKRAVFLESITHAGPLIDRSHSGEGAPLRVTQPAAQIAPRR